MGGPSPQEKAAASSQANLTNQLSTIAGQRENYEEAQRNKTTPFYTGLMNEGPSYYPAAVDYAGGINAKAFAPAKANLLRRLGASTGLPSGYRDQALTDFDEGRAGQFDSSLMSILADRQAGQERGAAGLMGEAQQANPLAYFQGAMGGNQSILNAGPNLRKPGFASILSGAAGAASPFFM